VVLLDQMPLNMFRGQPESFSTEAQSREVAGRAIERGLDQSLPDNQKAFLYLPYMHSEALVDQDRSVELFERAGLRENLRWAKHHRGIVRRFGRFPHRNAILGRESTPDEIEWLASPDSFNPTSLFTTRPPPRCSTRMTTSWPTKQPLLNEIARSSIPASSGIVSSVMSRPKSG